MNEEIEQVRAQLDAALAAESRAKEKREFMELECFKARWETHELRVEIAEARVKLADDASRITDLERQCIRLNQDADELLKQNQALRKELRRASDKAVRSML